MTVSYCFISLDVTFCPLSQPATPFRETSIQVAVFMGNSSRSIHVLIHGSTVALVLGRAGAVDAFAEMEVIFINSNSHTAIGVSSSSVNLDSADFSCSASITPPP